MIRLNPIFSISKKVLNQKLFTSYTTVVVLHRYRATLQENNVNIHIVYYNLFILNTPMTVINVWTFDKVS